jgi:hypothetical protein
MGRLSIMQRAVLGQPPPANGSAPTEPYGAVAQHEVRSLVRDQRRDRRHDGHSSLKCRVTRIAPLQSAVAPVRDDSAIGGLANSAMFAVTEGAAEQHKENILVSNKRQGRRVRGRSDLQCPAPESAARGDEAHSSGLHETPRLVHAQQVERHVGPRHDTERRATNDAQPCFTAAPAPNSAAIGECANTLGPQAQPDGRSVRRNTIKRRQVIGLAQPHSAVAPTHDDTALSGSAISMALLEPHRVVEQHEDHILVPSQRQCGRVPGRFDSERREIRVG